MQVWNFQPKNRASHSTKHNVLPQKTDKNKLRLKTRMIVENETELI